MRILVAEDNHVNQKVILAQLKRLGYEADVVTNGVEAVQATEVRTYDVILMDLHMPEMDGLTAAHEIRDRLAARAPAIVALTADASSEARKEMDDCVLKPIRITELRAALRRCATSLRGQRRRAG